MEFPIKYSKLKPGYFEKKESIELLRALENNMKMGSNSINSNSFSIDIIEDYRLSSEDFFVSGKHLQPRNLNLFCNCLTIKYLFFTLLLSSLDKQTHLGFNLWTLAY